MKLPATSRLKRDILPDGNEGAFHHVRHDRTTLFFDVFRSRDDARIIALGPVFRNLAADLLPLRVHCHGHQLPVRVRPVHPRDLVQIVEIRPLRRLMRAGEPWELAFHWRDGHVASLTLPPNDLGVLRPVGMTLVTLQKNNHPLWIRDWCQYHHRVHGVERVVVYDNGSSNVQAVELELARLGPGLETVLVHWPFPFGDHRNMFCQAGALNHCLHMVGPGSAYFLNFDIDEYLVNGTPGPLKDYLKKHLSGNVASLSVDYMTIPNVQESPASPASPVPRVSDFRFRQRHRASVASGKTIFRREGTRHVFIHHVATDAPRWRGMRFWDKLQRAYWRLGERLPFARLLFCFSEKRVSRDDLVYRHYMGLFTGYKVAPWRDRTQFHPRRHVEDAAFLKVLKEHGIGRSDDHDADWTPI